MAKVTMNDVAKHAGVSKATVSYVLNNVDKVSEETKERVWASIKKLGYVPNSSAQSLARSQDDDYSKNDLKSSILDDNPFYREFIQSFVTDIEKIKNEKEKAQLLQAMKSLNYTPSTFLRSLALTKRKTLCIICAYEDDEYCAEIVNCLCLIAGKKGMVVQCISLTEVEGMSFEAFTGICVVGDETQKLKRLLESYGKRVVFINEYGGRNHITLAHREYVYAYESVRYLIEQGYTSIGFFGADVTHGRAYYDRYAGFADALRDHSLFVKRDHVFFDDMNLEGGRRVATNLSKVLSNLEVLFCIHDVAAIGVIKGLHEQGYFVPNDLSVMVFQDSHASLYSTPSLTTVKRNMQADCEQIISTMLHGKEFEETQLKVEIVERESVIKKEMIQR